MYGIGGFRGVEKERFERVMECRARVTELSARIKESRYVEDRIHKARMNY